MAADPTLSSLELAFQDMMTADGRHCIRMKHGSAREEEGKIPSAPVVDLANLGSE